jgi:uncharacterized protein YhaN
MKILELQLLAFGPFTDLRLDLTAGEQGLHVLFGPNEAGKSSALRALRALLYGIPNNTTDNFQHENPKLRIGGRLRHSDGTELGFIRRKGLRNTLLGPDERPIPDTSLSKFLAGVSQELFSTMFGIDHPALRRGGEEILRGGGEVGQSLFSAALGGVSLRHIQDSLDHEAGQLFLARGQTPKINKSLAEYSAAKRTITEYSLRGEAWMTHKRTLEETMAARQRVLEELNRLTTEQHRLERLRAAVPKIAKRRELSIKLQEFRDVVPLPPEFAEQRREAVQALEYARETANDSRHKLEHLAAERQALVVPEVLLEQAETIAVLQQRLGSHRQAAQERSDLQGRRRQLEGDVRALLAKLPPTLSLEQVKERRLQVAHRARVQELARQYQARVERLARATQDVQKYAEHLTRTVEALNSIDAPRDLSELRRTVARARQQGPLEDAREQARAALQKEVEQAQVELRQLGLWSGTLEELERLPIPSLDVVDQYETTFRRLESEAHRLKDAIQKTQAELAEVDRQLAELQRAGAVPSEEDLSRARAHRNHLWRRVRRAWLDGEEMSQTPEAPGTRRDLAEAYQGSVDDADEVADRLRREAERVTRQATWLAQREKSVKTLEQLAAESNTLDAELCQHRQQWHRLWQPVGMTPLSPREMRAWLDRHGKLMQRAERVREDRRQLNRLHECIQQHTTALRQAMAHLGEPSAAADDALNTILARSEALMERIEDSVRQRQELQKQRTTAERELEGARRDQQEAAERLDHWQTEWTAAVAGLGLDGKSLPVEANAILEILDELLKKLDETEGFTQRLEGIDRDARDFAADVKLLVARTAPDLVDTPAEHAAVQLQARLARAQADAAREVELDRQIKAQEAALQAAQSTIERMAARLQALCRQARCTHPDELPAAESRSAQLQLLQKDITTLEEQLLDQGAGATIDQLIQEAEAIDADALPAQLGEITQQLDALEAMRSQLDQAIGSEQTILDQMDGSAKAAEAAEKAQALLAELREGVDHYVRLRLASMMLRHEIERYRVSHQGPLLSRASELFAQLTLGSFAKLDTDYNDGNMPVLVGVRADGRQVGINGMSDGSRDQLYLALRLASLERYLANNEPLPFIVDDILIQFDDQRAKAALQVLAELSMKTQVIFLTHHWRLAELAKDLKGPAVVQVHSLGA